MRLLVVDDDHDSRVMLQTYFKLNTSWAVTVAESGEDALFKYSAECAAGRPFDAIVLDIAMPDMSGLKVAEIIRKSGDQVPIIFLTAYDRVLNRHGAEDVGAAGYLVKSGRPEEVRGEVERVTNANQL